MEVLEVNEENVNIRITGTSQAIAQTDHDAHWRVRRIDAELLGFAVYDRASKRFSEFELVAIGKLFPKTDSDAKDARPIGWHFALADPDNPAERISPTHMYAYQGEWVVKPGIALHGLQPGPGDRKKMKNDK